MPPNECSHAVDAVRITYSVDAKGKGKSTISSTKPLKCTSSNQDGGTVWTCETH